MSSLAVVGQVAFERLHTFLEELATTEGRLAVSAVVLVVTVLSAALVVPYLIRMTSATIRNRLLPDRAAAAVDVFTGYIPTTVSGIFLRSIQLTLVVVGFLALLIVWGLVDVVLTVVQFIDVSLDLVIQLLVTFGLLLVAYVAMRLLADVVEQFSEGADRVTDHQQEIILRVGNLGVTAFAITALLTLWGIDLSGLLVGAGFLGIVVGLAARQTLGSMIAGFVLMFSRPFTIGDWVAVGDNEGIVTDITIMNTRLKNFDGESIIMPNDTVSNRPITNRSEQGHLRIRIDVGVDYESDPEHAEDVALEAIAEVDSVALAPPPQVVPKSFGDSAIILELRFWIDRPTPPRRWRATTAVIHAVKEAFEREGIKIPYPQRELSGRAETGGFRVHGSASDVDTPEEVEPEPSPED
jgi:small-conductance mechanosensitive channel